MKNRKQKRMTRIRKKILKSGRLRLTVFRSNMHIYAQIIDDKIAKVVLAVSENNLKEVLKSKIEKAHAVGIKIAEMAKEKKISEIVFDKGAYKYHGRVKALAEGARKGGLKF